MRFYFDANFSPHFIKGLGAIQDGRKSDDVTVHSVAEEFGQSSPDEEWIPRVASRHGIVITQDINIHRAQAQWALCQANKIGIFFFQPPKSGWDYWFIVQLIIRRWAEMTSLARGRKKPFGYIVKANKHRMSKL